VNQVMRSVVLPLFLASGVSAQSRSLGPRF